MDIIDFEIFDFKKLKILILKCINLLYCKK